MLLSGFSRLSLPCERFQVTYLLQGTEKEVYAKARDICLEQTVEFPEEFIPEGLIKEHIVGQIESLESYDEDKDSFLVVISYAIDSAASELTQLINVIFGNISIKPGIRVEHIELPDALLENFKGPRFGREGLRELLGVKKRPLIFTALKPMGLTSQELAELAYQFALGGIDIIKDDHGLSNQPFSPYEERVSLCSEAVRKANQETGNQAIYVANITGPVLEVKKRAITAKEVGAGGVLISPGLTGFDMMREVAEDDQIALPVISHPAFLGSYVMGTSGLSHHALFGQMVRLAGADGTIYPNFGGRFSFSRSECESIVQGTEISMGNLKPIFPCPAGGMSLSSVPESLKVYGNEVAFLIGGGLFKQGPDLIENSRYFRELVEKLCDSITES